MWIVSLLVALWQEQPKQGKGKVSWKYGVAERHSQICGVASRADEHDHHASVHCEVEKSADLDGWLAVLQQSGWRQ